MGNGITNPEIQYPYYPQMAYRSKTTPKIVDHSTFKDMEKHVPKCTSLIHQCQKDDVACSEAFDNCNEFLISPVEMTGVNVYDARKQCKLPPLCGDFSHVKKFLSSARVQKILGVKQAWAACNFGINMQFHTDWMKNQAIHIPALLENKIRVMIYAGDVDFICNWMGNKAWTMDLPWSQKDAFNKAPDRVWKVNDVAAGRERRVGPFTFLQIHKAGHMVPSDQPAHAMIMVENFLKGATMVEENMEAGEMARLEAEEAAADM